MIRKCKICDKEFEAVPEVTINMATKKEQTNIPIVCSAKCAAKYLSEIYDIPVKELR